MIALIQRVNEASVTVDGATVAAIGHGLLALIGIEKTDTAAQAARLQQKLLNYRVFADADGKMNLNVIDAAGELLLVSQFTLAANTTKGNRPGFDPAMPPMRRKRCSPASAPTCSGNTRVCKAASSVRICRWRWLTTAR